MLKYRLVNAAGVICSDWMDAGAALIALGEGNRKKRDPGHYHLSDSRGWM